MSAVSKGLPGVEGAGGASGTFTCSCLFTDLPPPARTTTFRAVDARKVLGEGMYEGARMVKAFQALHSGCTAGARTRASGTTMSEQQNHALATTRMPRRLWHASHPSL